MSELMKIGGRSLPTDGAQKTLPPEQVLPFSLRLLEILAVILEPTMDELQKDAHEDVLRDMIDCDPAVGPGPKSYPNEYLLRILLDNYAPLVRLASLYFNLSLSSLVTRFLVNLVYNLECWEIYHLLPAMPQLEYFLDLVGFEVTTTLFGPLVRPPENFLGYNLRQGLHYPFPFCFYNYSYHSTRAEAFVEKYNRVPVVPYLDIRLMKGARRPRGRPKSQRFSSAVGERFLEAGILPEAKKAAPEAAPKVPDPSVHFRLLGSKEIEDDYRRMFSGDSENSDGDTLEGDEHLEHARDYYSDSELRQRLMFSRRFKFVHSRYAKRQMSRRHYSKRKARSRDSKFVSEPVSAWTAMSPADFAATAALKDPRPLPPESPASQPGAGYTPVKDPNQSSGAVADISGSANANPGPSRTPYLSPRVVTQSAIQSYSPAASMDAKAPDAYEVPERTRHKSVIRKVDVPDAPTQTVPGNAAATQNNPQLGSSLANQSTGWPPCAGMAAPTHADARGPSQFATVPNYQLPMRVPEADNQHPSGQMMPHIETVPKYGFAPYAPYPRWIALALPGLDKQPDAEQFAEQQQLALLMSAYQKYGYTDGYYPYMPGYLGFPAPMYQRPDQMYYAQGAPNMAYVPPDHTGMYPLQYMYMGQMYAPQYQLQAAAWATHSDGGQGHTRKPLVGGPAPKKTQPKEK